jgi:hypothetical protein
MRRVANYENRPFLLTAVAAANATIISQTPKLKPSACSGRVGG